MTLKQEINHRTIQKACHLHNGIFHSINLYHTLCHTINPLCYSLKITNYEMREKNIFCIYMAASARHVISKEV